MSRLGVVGCHAQPPFQHQVELVEQVCVYAYSGGDNEVTRTLVSGKVEVPQLSQGDSPRLGGKRGVRRTGSVLRNSEIMRERVRGAQGDDAQRSGPAHHALQDIVDRAVAAAGEDSVAPCRNRLARLLAGPGARMRCCGVGFHPRSS